MSSDKIIFHEKQQGELCAQHCLNALLQEDFFNAVDLANLGEQLDREERARLAEGGTDSEDYLRFCSSRSQNMDDSGFFSVQVIAKALQVANLELISFDNPHMTQYQNDPTTAQAFICNFNQHWFTIRKFANQWMNLDSVKSKPEPLSDNYLRLYLAQLKNDGYSIYVIKGTLPGCLADEYLSKNPLPEFYRVQQSLKHSNKTYKVDNFDDDNDDPTYQEAIENSLRDTEDYDLELALRMSLEQ